MESINKKKTGSGTGVALITPFQKDGTVDYNSLEKIIQFNIENGIDYFVTLGTTGESVTLSADEKKEVVRQTIKFVNRKKPVVLGIGGNNTTEVANQIKSADLNGIDAILSVSPYYNKPSQEGIFRHYMELEKITPLPIIIYNVPGRTASNITAETTIRLANASKKFLGIKEASGNLSQCSLIRKNTPKEFLLISGDDALTLPMMSFGACGVISVVAQATPQKFSAMVNSALENNFSEAGKLHLELTDLWELLFAEGSPGGIKAALNILGLCENELRLPLVQVGEGLKMKIEVALKN